MGWGGVGWAKKIRDTSFVYIDQLQRRSRNDKRQGIVNAEKFHTNQNIQKQNKVDRSWMCFGLHVVLIFILCMTFFSQKKVKMATSIGYLKPYAITPRFATRFYNYSELHLRTDRTLRVRTVFLKSQKEIANRTETWLTELTIDHPCRLRLRTSTSATRMWCPIRPGHLSWV